MSGRLALLFFLATAVPGVAWSQVIWVPGLVVEKAAVRIDPAAAVPLATLDRGTDVTVLAVRSDWLEIAFEDQRYGRRVGYVPRSTVRFAMPGARAAAPTVPATNAPKPASPAAAAAPVVAAPVVAAPVAAASAAAAPVAPGPAAPAVTPAAPPAISAAAPTAAVRTVEHEFPASTGNAPVASAKPSPTPATTARPAVRTVESEFPSSARRASPATPDETSAERRGRTVMSIGDAFPESASSRPAVSVSKPVAPAAPVEASARSAAPEPDSGRVNAAPPAPAIASRGARASVSPRKGQSLTLLIPRALMKEEGRLAMRKVPIVSADVTGAEGERVSVNGVTAWMQAGLPSLIEASVKKVVRNKDHTELELRATGGEDVVVKLRFAHSLPDPQAALGELVVEGGADTAAAKKYRDEAHAAIAGTVFTGNLEALEDRRKLSILSTLQRLPGAPDVALHDGRLRASFDLGVDETVYNDRTADDGTIVAQVLNETVLPRVRDLVKPLSEVPELHGARVLYRIPHKAKLSATTKEYRVELVAGMADVVKFASNALTHQEFVNAAKVIVDGEAVTLTFVGGPGAATGN